MLRDDFKIKNGKFNDIKIKGGRGSAPKHYFIKHLNHDISRRGWGSEGDVTIENTPQNPYFPTNLAYFPFNL